MVAGLIFAQRLAKKRLIAELNKQLTVKVMLHSVDISGLANFPNIGVRFHNLRVDQSKQAFPGHLVKAGSLTVVVNAWDLINGKNTIQKLQLQNGEIQIYEDEFGNNYSIFKTDSSQTDSSSETHFTIDLKKIDLKNVRLVYESKVNNQSLNCFIEDSKAKAKLDDEHMQLAINGTTVFDHLESEGTEYLLGKRIQMDLDLDVNQKINSYYANKAELVVDGLPLSLSGSALLQDNNPNLDLEFNSEGANIKGLIALLPKDLALGLSSWNSNGMLDIKGTLKGVISAMQFPKTDIQFKINNGQLRNEKYRVEVGSLSLSGHLTNNNKPSIDALALDIDLREFKTKRSSLKGNISVKSFASPNTAFKLKGHMYLDDLNALIPQFNIQQGKIQLNTEGTLVWDEKAKNFNYPRSAFFGDIELTGLDLKTDGIKLENIAASGRLKGRDWNNVKLTGRVQSSDVDFKGSIRDWATGAMASKTGRALINGDLKVGKFDLDEFMPEVNQETAEVMIEAAPRVYRGERMLDIGWDADLDLTAESFTYGEMFFEQIGAEVQLRKNRIVIPALKLKAMEGSARIKTSFEQEGGFVSWGGNFYLDQIRIDEFFRQFDDFGQSEITHKHLSGLLTSECDLYMQFDHLWNALTKDLVLLTKLNIKNGELKGYKPLESLSSFVEVEDLRHIKFSELKNVIRIEDETIHIPTMSIKNSALNMDISGTHTFENVIDYKLQLSLTELLAKKSGWIKERKRKELESVRGGGMKTYVLITGTVDDPKVRFDKKAVTKKIKEEAKAERKKFFKNLKKEIRGERIESEDTKPSPWDE